ncbi:hypothetical protein MNEG_0698 [Monoraphidium neglectum]|uniref:Clp R domain-containing protein n=1 Tax=Monoraphidium neglectum TaxID=145388 RepID=A0A0D2LLL0_9CHLO|nr:hypothetical protein MNEG_0698 [Monoraphidium neglectum]KIZ07244.1 hypothetical protein MNEG_0698 [Monoraphidium neglectum]|eukprot:XP_013906263.1 hypothetical protein MNEG_0698 [Monoraphidium neglectum]
MRLSSGSHRLQRSDHACSVPQRPSIPQAAPRFVAAAAAAARGPACGATTSSSCSPATAATAPPSSQQQQFQISSLHQQQQHRRRRQPSWIARDAAALASASIDEDLGPSSIGPDAAQIIAYAMQIAWTGETYEVHAWMLLLGLLKDEGCAGAKALQRLGITDLYGAWHEVLWALNVSNGLEPRAASAQLSWAPGAYKVLNGAARFAGWAGRDKVASQDILLALGAAGSLEHLFPDIAADFDTVRRAVGEETGDRYRLPGEDPKDAATKNQDLFL